MGSDVIVCGPGWNDELGAFFERHGGGEYRRGAQCFGILRDGNVVACVLFDGWNGASVYMHVAASVRHWCSRQYRRVVFDYAFRQLGCRAIIGLVAESNLKARRFDEHLGFIESGRITDGCPDGDLIIYALHRGRCKWYEVENVKAESPSSA